MMESPYPQQFSYGSLDNKSPVGNHGDQSSFGNHGNSSKLHAENEYLKERVRSCEKGLSGLYQLVVPKPPEEQSPLSHYRSASLTIRSRSNSHCSPSPIPEPQFRPKTADSAKTKGEGRVVTFPELKEAIVALVNERDQLALQLDDYRQIAEAAKRERLLAIDEKDLLLKESHELRVALERVASKIKEADSERRELTNQIGDLEKEVITLRRTNNEAIKMRTIALEERSKLINEFSRLQNELTTVQNERSELLDETSQLQSVLSQLTNGVAVPTQLMNGSHSYSRVAEATRRNNKANGGGGLRIWLVRMTPGQPWGFSLEGGRGSNCYHGNQRVIVSAVLENSPAYGLLFAGDCLLSIGSYNLQNVTRQEALEIVRSCDQVSVELVISRTNAMCKPAPKEVKIPGRKSFGFSFETRMFISGVERGSLAAECLRVGDEITKVMDKPTINMKPSVLKQLLKSCKDGVSMTIVLPTDVVTNGDGSSSDKMRYSSDSSHSLGSQSVRRTSDPQYPSCHYQAPGTPRSTISEASAGYHSLTHSMPSILSTTVSPVAMETKTSQTGLDSPDSRASETIYHQQHSEHDFSLTGARCRAGSVLSSRQRPMNVYAPRRNTVSHSPGQTRRTRATSLTSYNPAQTTLASPRGVFTPTYCYKGTSLPRGTYPNTLSQGHTPMYNHFPSNQQQQRKQVISMSMDHLDSDLTTKPHPPAHHSCISRTMSQGNHMIRTSSHDMSGGGHITPSHESHMTRKRRPISMSMGSMTNV